MENKITPPNVVILPTPLNKKAEHVEQSQKHNDDKSKIAVDRNNKSAHPLSEEGKRMSKQFSEQSTETIDPNRVAEIKQAVKNGTIKIDDNSIAERLLQIEGELSETSNKE